MTNIQAASDKRSTIPIVAEGQDSLRRLREVGAARRRQSRRDDLSALERRRDSQAQFRALWLDVGSALAYGKSLGQSDHDYHAWLAAHGFDGLTRHERMHALWFAANFVTLGDIPDGIGTPGTIRQWARIQQKRQELRETSKRVTAAVPGARSKHESGASPISDDVRTDLIKAAEHLQQAIENLLMLVQMTEPSRLPIREQREHIAPL